MGSKRGVQKGGPHLVPTHKNGIFMNEREIQMSAATKGSQLNPPGTLSLNI